MKKCPYCAEEIQDEAILCRYCHSDLTVAPPSSASSATPTSQPPASSQPAASTQGEAPASSQEQPRGSGLGDTFAFGPGGSSTPGPEAGGDRGSETTTTAADEVEPSDATERSPDIAETPGASAVMGAEAATSTPTGAETSDADDVATTSPVQTAPASAPSSTVGSTAGTESAGVAAAGPGPGAAAAAAAATGTPAPDSATPGAMEPGPVTYTHSGHRYVLGYGADFFGIWDRQAPATPVERFPRTDDGWRQAWQRYVGLEPSNVEVAAGASGPGAPGPSPSAGAPAPGVATPAGSGPAMQYTHSGQRYLLGYGADFFGIWDRQTLAQPVQRFPRTDDGWRAAWQQYASWEPHSTEVGIGGGS